MTEFGKLKYKAEGPFKAVEKVVKPNSKLVNKKLMKGLKVYLNEHKRLERSWNIVRKGRLASEKSVVEVDCQSFEEWLNVLEKNYNNDILCCDDPRHRKLGYNFVKAGKIMTYMIGLVAVKEYHDKNPECPILKCIASSDRFNLILGYLKDKNGNTI